MGKSIVQVDANERSTIQLLETDPYGQVAIEVVHMQHQMGLPSAAPSTPTIKQQLFESSIPEQNF